MYAKKCVLQQKHSSVNCNMLKREMAQFQYTLHNFHFNKKSFPFTKIRGLPGEFCLLKPTRWTFTNRCINRDVNTKIHSCEVKMGQHVCHEDMSLYQTGCWSLSRNRNGKCSHSRCSIDFLLSQS